MFKNRRVSMENKRKLNTLCYSSLIFVLLCGLFLKPIGMPVVHAEEEPSSEESHSGGFIIESDRVEGAMDLAEALGGNVEIEEGLITGLKITKVLEVGEGEEPLVIIIKSPGPIPIKELSAKTRGGGLPDFAGLCLDPIEVGWLCLEDVTMEVTSQSVEEIDLPNAEIESCYLSECEDVGISEAEIEAFMANVEEEGTLLSLDEIKDGLEDDRELLKEIKKHMTDATETHEELEKEHDIEEMGGVIDELTSVLEELYKGIGEDPEIAYETLDDIAVKDIPEYTDGENGEDDIDVEEKLANVVEETVEHVDSYETLSIEYVEIVEEAVEKMEELSERITEKEKSLEKIEKELVEEEEEMEARESDSNNEQAELLSELVEMDEENNESDNEETIDPDAEDKIDIDEFKEELTEFKEEFTDFIEEMNQAKETLDDLVTLDEEIGKDFEGIMDQVSDLQVIYKDLMDRFEWIDEEYEVGTSDAESDAAAEDSDPSAEEDGERAEDSDSDAEDPGSSAEPDAGAEDSDPSAEEDGERAEDSEASAEDPGSSAEPDADAAAEEPDASAEEDGERAKDAEASAADSSQSAEHDADDADEEDPDPDAGTEEPEPRELQLYHQLHAIFERMFESLLALS